MRISDWSSDVCSSDLAPLTTFDAGAHLRLPHGLTISGGVSDIFNAGPKQKMHRVGSNDGLHQYHYWKCNYLEADETGDYSCFDDEANLVRQNYTLNRKSTSLNSSH